MGSAEAALKTLCNPDNEVSAHYLIARDGRVFQMVEEEMRAWHAGAGRWGGYEDVNSSSIGIEMDNDGYSPFSNGLMSSLEVLLRGILDRHAIVPEGVIGHSDLAPGRKIDPGRRFDWVRLERQGLAAPRGCAPAEPSQFRQLAQARGFTADVDDETLLSAVRLRFRPAAEGPLEPADVAPLTQAGVQA